MYNNLSAEMVRANISISELTEDIGITRQSFNNKKKDISKWTINDMVKIQEYINSKQNTNYTLDYLFQKD